MSIISILIIIALIVLIFIALKFLVGAARTIVSIVLIVIAIAFLVYLLTGHDPFGVVSATENAAGKAMSYFKG